MQIKLAFENILSELDREKKYINEEVFKNTPSRMEEFYTEFFSGLKINPYDFLKNYIPTNNNDIIIEKNISFYSMCEHHLLPFFGKISIAYIPNKKIIGFGDIIKVIEAFSKRPQLQERLTENIVETIFKGLDCKGVYLFIEAEHLCMTMRGVKKPGSKIVTVGTRGIFEKDTSKRLEIATLLKKIDLGEFMDKIIIKNLELIGNHGVFKEEKILGQKFIISVEMQTDTYLAAKSDNLNYSTNYGMVANDIENLFSNNSFNLIETCAEKIAEMILLNYNLVNNVIVSIKKPWAPIQKHFDFVSVEISRKWHRVFLSLGSNIGDKKRNLSEAINLIEEIPNTHVNKISTFINTEPYGLKEQDDFVNTCIEIKTLFSPHDLLDNLLNIEKKMGRVRTIKWGPRLIDIDIILFDDLVIQDNNLAIPHPYMCDRIFVLTPLKEIAPNVIHPLEKKTISFLENLLNRNVYD